MSRQRPPCGTAAGYSAHKRRYQDACQPCKDAAAAQKRARQTGQAELLAPELAPCGTSAGHARHRYRKEPVCAECQNAKNADAKTWDAAKPQSRDRLRRYEQACRRAMKNLVNRHAEEMDALVAAELGDDAPYYFGRKWHL